MTKNAPEAWYLSKYCNPAIGQVDEELAGATWSEARAW